MGHKEDRHSLPSHNELIELLASTPLIAGVEIGSQAYACPYYVPISGDLGRDWGVILNPESSCFGSLVFEHDDCGCPPALDEDECGWGRH